MEQLTLQRLVAKDTKKIKRPKDKKHRWVYQEAKKGHKLQTCKQH